MKKILLLIFTIFLSGCTSSSFFNKQPLIIDFDSCKSAGHPVMKTIPLECHYQDQIFIQEPSNPNIKVDSIKTNQTIESPLTITGEAKGTWFFEGTFLIKLVDSQGKLIAQTMTSTKEEWMTSNFISFSATLEFISPGKINTGTLIFVKENPSDMRELDDQLSIPVLY